VEHTLAILDRVGPRFVLPLVVIERGGLRVGELVSLTWGDVDAAGSRLRLPGSRTKTGQPRWVPLPTWLTEAIEATCPLEDRVPERRLFPGLTDAQLRTAMRRACTLARIPAHGPHSLRHRRASLWHHDGVSARELADRIGHANPTLTLNVYSHTLPDGEIPEERLRALVAARALLD
jgi:integrase